MDVHPSKNGINRYWFIAILLPLASLPKLDGTPNSIRFLPDLHHRWLDKPNVLNKCLQKDHWFKCTLQNRSVKHYPLLRLLQASQDCASSWFQQKDINRFVSGHAFQHCSKILNMLVLIYADLHWSLELGQLLLPPCWSPEAQKGAKCISTKSWPSERACGRSRSAWRGP